MRVGDLTSEWLGKLVTIRDQDNADNPEWVVQGKLVGIEHQMTEPHTDPLRALTKVSLWVGPHDQQMTQQLLLRSDYEL